MKIKNKIDASGITFYAVKLKNISSGEETISKVYLEINKEKLYFSISCSNVPVTITLISHKKHKKVVRYKLKNNKNT